MKIPLWLALALLTCPGSLVYIYRAYDNDPSDREIAMISYPDTIMAGGREGLPITLNEAKAGIR
ncbi:MAG TPA: hypothetical protein DCZ01_04425 [Elusimicrobia bacterium]|nr:MAG: hypothetical protein A2X37_10645 [Elusimicrobia bacterium GWA2_66_18]OGR77229.1 MAG: hypothetical protein A2X40_01070 [Elusimicrobia bacterium GWC2_65_9]HAZ07770.1 hypothetical protein [Elusimicrobiota bacterium]